MGALELKIELNSLGMLKVDPELIFDILLEDVEAVAEGEYRAELYLEWLKYELEHGYIVLTDGCYYVDKDSQEADSVYLRLVELDIEEEA